MDSICIGSSIAYLNTYLLEGRCHIIPPSIGQSFIRPPMQLGVGGGHKVNSSKLGCIATIRVRAGQETTNKMALYTNQPR